MNEVSLPQALEIVSASVSPLPMEHVPLSGCCGRTVSGDVIALLDVPSADVSSKDGYAVVSADLEGASPQSPVRLELAGQQFAGFPRTLHVARGKAVKITTGAAISPGADAVVPLELAAEAQNAVTVSAPLDRGRNILPRASDIRAGSLVVPKGKTITPADVGLIAAAGVRALEVFGRPRVAVIATGDELVPAGEPAGGGKIPASNMAAIRAWCERYGMECREAVVPDDFEEIGRAVADGLRRCDCVITSGGTWIGGRDLVAGVLDRLGWQVKLRHVRMSPGKSVFFGMLQSRPIFCLPGSPAANQAAFLLLALPALLSLCGRSGPALPSLPAVLERDVAGREGFTLVTMGRLARGPGHVLFTPIDPAGQLMSLSLAQGLLLVPEGTATIPAGSPVDVIDLRV
jgi:molybdopterin molybdotransferase